MFGLRIASHSPVHLWLSPSERTLHLFFGAAFCESLSLMTTNGASRNHGGQSPQRANKMRKPTSFINEGEHQARLRFWMKTADLGLVPSTFNWFVAMIDWDRRWRKFENGDEPICVCEDAAREMGMVW